MPRARTDAERKTIRGRLLEAGQALFERHGLPKTTIADLARDAGIGKGTFYQFFDSKEALFVAVQEREERLFKAVVSKELHAATSGREAVRALLLTASQRLQRHPFLRLLLDPLTISTLTLRLPPEALEQNETDDRAFVESLVTAWQRRGWLLDTVTPEIVFDVLASLFVMSRNRDLIGADTVARATAELADAVAARWCPA